MWAPGSWGSSVIRRPCLMLSHIQDEYPAGGCRRETAHDNWPPQRPWVLGCVEPGRRQVPDLCPLDLVQIMGETLKDPVIKRCCEAPNRLSDLQHISEGLEKCQKSLNDYLDSKRNAFPRFFFISDDELLSILGSSDPLCVQEHMIKVGQASGVVGGSGGLAWALSCGLFSPSSLHTVVPPRGLR